MVAPVDTRSPIPLSLSVAICKVADRVKNNSFQRINIVPRNLYRQAQSCQAKTIAYRTIILVRTGPNV